MEGVRDHLVKGVSDQFEGGCEGVRDQLVKGVRDQSGGGCEGSIGWRV